MNVSNVTTLTSVYPDIFYDFDDATWTLTSVFAIVSVQAGLALREAGVTSTGNDVNVMTKCICGVVLGGLAFWIFGYALSFGRDYGSNPFCGWGWFFAIPPDPRLQGWQFSHFFFHLSYVAMVTTIVSGAMAGRSKFKAFMVYCVVDVLMLAFPFHWVWGYDGWLKQLGVLDASGAGPVHVVGGTCSLVVTLLLRPRLDKFNPDKPPPRESPQKMLMGTCLLWCGFQGLAIGSAFGVNGLKWKLATRAVVNTFISSSTGATVTIILSYSTNKLKLKAEDLSSGILGALVGVSGISRVTHPWAAMVIGGISALLAYSIPLGMRRLKVDDPVNGVAIHGACGLWAVISVGIFGVLELEGPANSHRGMIEGGGFYLLGVQILEGVILIIWSGVISATIFKVIDVTIGLRVTPEVEAEGNDLYEHGIGKLPSGTKEDGEEEEENAEEKEDDADDSSSEGSQENGERFAIESCVLNTKDEAKVSYVDETVIVQPPSDLKHGIKTGTITRSVPRANGSVVIAPVNSSKYAVEIERSPDRVPHKSVTVVGVPKEQRSKHVVEDGTISKKIALEKKDSGYDSGSAEDTTKNDRRHRRSIKGSLSKACSILFSNDRPLSSIPEASAGEEGKPEESDSDTARKSILRIIDRKSESLNKTAKVLRFLEGERVTYPSMDTFPRVSKGQTLTFMFHDSD